MNVVDVYHDLMISVYVSSAQGGTDVTFLFDFGDGSSRTERGTMAGLGFNSYIALVQHTFTRSECSAL